SSCRRAIPAPPRRTRRRPAAHRAARPAGHPAPAARPRVPPRLRARRRRPAPRPRPAPAQRRAPALRPVPAPPPDGTGQGDVAGWSPGDQVQDTLNVEPAELEPVSGPTTMDGLGPCHLAGLKLAIGWP